MLILAATLFCGTGVGKGAAVQAKEPATNAAKATVAVFSLDGTVTEKPATDDFLFGSTGQEALKDLVERMDKAAKDDAVKAVVMLVDSSSHGAGKIEEIRDAMQRLRTAGKEIYTHADSLDMAGYVLLSGATKVSVAPTGLIWINGIYGEGMYIRGLLDMLGVTPDFLTCGDYKSAAETFMRKGPSKEAAEMQGWLYDSLFESYVQFIAEGRGVKPEQARAWIDNALYSAEEAAKAGIIDAAEDRADFVKQLKDKYGNGIRFDKSYAKKKGPQIDFGNPFAAFQLWSQILFGQQERRSTKDAIAIVYVDGPIMTGKPEVSPFGSVDGAYSDPLRKALDKVADDDTVKAVVLRIDSPGGSAVASEIILQATKRVKAKKPFVVSMGNVAGSGGYYVACGADTIFADATTITGSIGVVSGKVSTTQMWNKIGIDWHPVKRGKNADMLGSSAVFTDDQRARMQAYMDDVYGVFKGHVTAARGDRLAKPIDELAGGRVFTGKQALELGLVDRIGGLNHAIQFVAGKANLDDYEVRVVPKTKNFLELLMGDISGQQKNEDDRTLSMRPAAKLGSGTLIDRVLPLLEGVDPARISAVKQALLQLEMLKHERVLMTMPVMYFSD
jgi:protease-4